MQLFWRFVFDTEFYSPFFLLFRVSNSDSAILLKLLDGLKHCIIGHMNI